MAKNNGFLTRIQTLPSYLLIALIQCYRYVVSGLMGRCCRFEPSCSLYAMEAIKTHGCVKGMYLAMKRIVRCQPWMPGGIDKVP